MKGKSRRKMKKYLQCRRRCFLHKLVLIDSMPVDDEVKRYMVSRIALNFHRNHAWAFEKLGICIPE